MKNSTNKAKEKKDQAMPIVGIGASAGGLKAFTQLLQRLPANSGMAFVLVQHLDPKHVSILPELLAKATKMPVHEVKDGMPVEPNHVYVIPANVNIAIFHGVLNLMPRTEVRGLHMPIDFFLRSLAEDQGNKAIGVILSGTASDGALGLKEIKAASGIAFAQDPDSAEYDGMPRSAVAAGVVDFILPPEDIAHELARIGQHPYISHPKVVEESKSEPKAQSDLMSKIFLLLRSTTGVDFTYYKQTTIKRRITRRMVVNKLDELGAYVKYLQENPAEVTALYQDILITVTDFFRDRDTFESLKSQVFPAIIKSKAPHEPIRVWVPGCSTGEEPYSMAMTLLESLEGISKKPPILIFATDINEIAIEKARAGIYPESITADVSPERLQRFFVKVEGG
jgi:two-component system CheB/CheR fusion protein